MRAKSARTRHPEATKRAVLEAAKALFAARGFAGTSMRDIAAASGVSQPLAQHHFGCKEQLYATVLRDAIEDYAARFPDAARVTDRPVDLRAEVARLFTFLRENEPQIRMIGWARLEGKHDLVTGATELRRAMCRRIERGQELGVVRPDVNAGSLCLMLEGLLMYWIENRALSAEIFPSPPRDDVYLANVVAVLERGFASEFVLPENSGPTSRYVGSGGLP